MSNCVQIDIVPKVGLWLLTKAEELVPIIAWRVQTNIDDDSDNVRPITTDNEVNAYLRLPSARYLITDRREFWQISPQGSVFDNKQDALDCL